MNQKLIESAKYIIGHCVHCKMKIPAIECAEILKQIEIYNEIPEELPQIVNEFSKFRDAKFEIGNENSFVMYVSLMTSRDKINLKEVQSEWEVIGLKYNADEISFNIQNFESCPSMVKIQIRYWWD